MEGSRAQPHLWEGLGPRSPPPTRTPATKSAGPGAGGGSVPGRGGGAAGLRRPGRGPAKLCEHGPHGCHSWGEAKPRLRHTPPATHVCRGHPADCAGDHSRWALSAHSSALRARPQSAKDGPACAYWVPPAGRTCVSPDTCGLHPTPDPTCSPCLHRVPAPHCPPPLPDPPGPWLGDTPQALACGTRAVPKQLSQQAAGSVGWDGPPQNSHVDEDGAADLAQGTGLKTAGGHRPTPWGGVGFRMSGPHKID